MLPEIYRSSRSPLPQNTEPTSPGGGWGFNFQNLPSTHVDKPPTSPTMPTYLPFKADARSQSRRPPSSITSSDEEVSSDLSSGSLETPPMPSVRLLTPIYGPIGLPPGASGTGRTAPVSLPTQTPGAGGMHPVNLPPSQSQHLSDADGVPTLGVVDEPPAQTTTASTRGRGSTYNRGKKRR